MSVINIANIITFLVCDLRTCTRLHARARVSQRPVPLFLVSNSACASFLQFPDSDTAPPLSYLCMYIYSHTSSRCCLALLICEESVLPCVLNGSSFIQGCVRH